MTNYELIKERIEKAAIKVGRSPGEIQLVAVTKNRSVPEIEALYQEGLRNFGENRVQEALPKMESMPNDINWHFIGTLQKNKVAKVIPKFSLIHSVDSLELAQKISTLSVQASSVTPILLQVNTSNEESKHGLSEEGWLSCLEELSFLPSIRIEGLMTMAPLTEDQAVIRNTFRKLRCFQEELKLKSSLPLSQLSMGMSHDFEIAIEEGATLLRIGTALFS